MRASLVGIAALAGILTYCYRQAKSGQTVARGQVKEDLRRWEGEGGNVPAVATPSPAPVPESSFPAAGSEARH
jgi:cytosine/adenosine deaminase-related metal-dependent hydrolase